MRSVAYSPDGRNLISGSDGCTIRIQDPGNGTAVCKPLEGHTGSVALPMSGTSLDLATAPFGSGILRLALQSASLFSGKLSRCGPLLTLPTGGTSSLDSTTAQFEFGMQTLVLQLALLQRNVSAGCSPLPILPMGGTSSPEPPTAPFESGMPRLVLQSERFSKVTPTRCCLLLALLDMLVHRHSNFPLPTCVCIAATKPHNGIMGRLYGNRYSTRYGHRYGHRYCCG